MLYILLKTIDHEIFCQENNNLKCLSNIRATHVELVLVALDEAPVRVFLVHAGALVARLAVDVDDDHILQSKQKTLDYRVLPRRRFEMQKYFRTNTDNGILIQHHSSRNNGLPVPPK